MDPVELAPSFMETAAARDDAIPFRELERAHRRVKLARQELAAANDDLEKACERMMAAGYKVRAAEPGDELEERAPIPDERFRAEAA